MTNRPPKHPPKHIAKHIGKHPPKRPSGEGLHLLLLNGETVRLRRFEALRIMLHPYLLAIYAVTWIGLTLTDPSGQNTHTSFGIRFAQYGAGVVTTALGMTAIYTLAELVFGGKGRVVTLSHWYVLLTVSIIGLSASEAVFFYLTGTDRTSLRIFAVLTVFYFVVIEVMLQLVIWLLLPRILHEIREDASAAETPSTETPFMPQARFQAGGRDIPPETVLHLEAQGNYVAIITDSHQYEVPGPFSALLDQLPQGLGLRVHRSHWVARRAVLAHRRKGRELVLDLVYGGVAKVALPRQADVIDWLAVTAPPPDQDRPTPASDATPA